MINVINYHVHDVNELLTNMFLNDYMANIKNCRLGFNMYSGKLDF